MESINAPSQTYCLPIFFSYFFLSGFLSPLLWREGEALAQPFSRWDSISVSVSGTKLPNPWAGGLNFPQFSSIDLDGSGYDDLFVFDRTGNKILTFLNRNIPDSPAFFHRPEYQFFFPPLVSWALLADYNSDGRQDIFTANPKGGVTVYRNDISTMKFTLMDNMLKAKYIANQYDLYVSPWDVPAISDIDGDGDRDILSFNVGGSFVVYYKNLSVETFGNTDSLLFEITEKCWGKFEEAAENCNITLDVSCKGVAPERNDSVLAKHAGSTLLALDLDGDMDKELLLGDLICNNLVQLTNGGNIYSAGMTEINKEYPPSFPVNITQFPAAFWLDVNNDDKNDLLAAPSAINISENSTGIWLYKNTGSNSIPQFEFSTKSFLQNEMIETGEGANPAFFDADGDSLLDLVIGNYGYHKPGATYISELSLYKNTGTKNDPSFELVTRDYANVSSLGLTGVHPCFGDLDGDQDLDMLIGETNGELFLFTNETEPGKPASFILTSPGYKNIDVGLCSAPQIVDVDRDGKQDLLLGERNGNVNYYRNTGTKTSAEFTLVSDSFGRINILEPKAITGYSIPKLVELDTIQEYALLVGSESGKIYRYKNIDNNLAGTFTLADSMFNDIWEGIRATVDAADLNFDGNPELIVGNYRGGVAIFRNEAPPRQARPTSDIFSLMLFPNPAVDYFHVNIPEIKSYAEIHLFNMLGESVLQQEFNVSGRYFITAKNFAPGIYYCRLLTDEELVFNEKIVFIK